MSASVGVYVATALFLAIGGDSEEAMQGYGDKPCNAQCEQRNAEDDGVQACVPGTKNDWGIECTAYIPQQLLSPKWVPSDQPTVHRNGDGMWMKLQL